MVGDVVILLVVRDIWVAIFLYKVTEDCTPLIIQHNTGFVTPFI
jgi:hypothetical protein